MVEGSVSKVMPAVLLTQQVQDFNGIVSTELLGNEAKVRSGKRVLQKMVQPASDAIGGSILRLRENDALPKSPAKFVVVLPFNKQQVPAELPQPRVDIDGQHAACGRNVFNQEGVVFFRAFLESPSAKEQSFRILVLAATDGLNEFLEAVPADHCCRLSEKEIVTGCRLRAEVAMYPGITRRGAIVFPVRNEISVEIDVILIRSSHPGHAKGIQNVNENHRCLRRDGG